MNKEYTYIDGKVIIKDEKGNQTLDEYYDNLDEVLIQENVVESMENKIRILEKESSDYLKCNKKRYIPIATLSAIVFLTVGIPITMYLLGVTDIFSSSVDTIFGTMNKALLYDICLSPSLIATALIDAVNYSRYKKDLKIEKGINKELDFLKHSIVREKESLKKLKQSKTRDKENKDFRVVEVNDEKALRILDGYSKLCFDLGYNEEKYHKYCQAGILDDKLRDQNYNEGAVELAVEYFEENGPTLVKKRNFRKK